MRLRCFYVNVNNFLHFNALLTRFRIKYYAMSVYTHALTKIIEFHRTVTFRPAQCQYLDVAKPFTI